MSSDVGYGQATNADSVVFRGQFSKLVTQLSAEDFVLSGTTAAITNIEVAYGSQFCDVTMTVSGGDLANLTGSITLSFAPGQDIADLQGRPLADTNLNMTVTVKIDNEPPQVNVTDVISLDGWGLGPGFGIQGSGVDRLDPAMFDWSKLWIAVDDGGSNITFSTADLFQTAYGTDFIGLILTASKLSEIDARVDGAGDRFVIKEGFWCDPLGNVQTVGGGIDILADMF